MGPVESCRPHRGMQSTFYAAMLPTVSLAARSAGESTTPVIEVV